jgi:3-oxoacyl-[acyl-carrier protein] reductase
MARTQPEPVAPVALVTGGGTGIGAACCRALAAAGFRVCIHYRSSAEPARRLAAELPGAIALRADLASAAEIDAMVADLKTHTTQVDVLVNNAGFSHNAPLVATSLEAYDTVAAVVRGTWYLTRLVVRRFMLRQRAGRIVNISSVVGHVGNPGQIPYTMAKASLDAFTKSLARELADYSILVNSVAPGFIDTDMTAALPDAIRGTFLERIPLRRVGTPAEVAEVVAFLATGASYVNGTVIHANGGLSGG